MGSPPLDGIRVVDLCRLLPGAFATRLLSDLGADVIKVEQPGVGDPMRAYEPRIGDASGYTWVTDRGKRSLAVNLRDPRGVDAILALIAGADVVVESFRPGVADRLGIGYDAARSRNPALVYCSISGYGATGPLAHEAGHDINYIGRAGLLGITGTAERPVVPGVQMADLAGGSLMGLTGLLAALVRAQRTNEGDHVDVAMTDGAFALQALSLGAHVADGRVPGRESELLNGGVPCYNVYACADGRHLTVGALEPPFWRALCDGVGRPDLLPTHSDPAAIPVWRALFAAATRHAWLARLAGVDACVGPVNDLAEALADPQLGARGMIAELDHPTAGPRLQLGTPMRFSEHALAGTAPAPALGNATRALLAEAGVAAEDIEAMLADGAAA
jgi:crotonobetainyl-CoA:carnitine CoA-transferase CaiB-like acyl-CoA transferase